MDNPIAEIERRQKAAVRKLERAAQAALSALKQNPDFADVQLRIIEQGEALQREMETEPPQYPFPSPERLDYALRLLDVWAGGYVRLVRTIADNDALSALLRSFERKAWMIYAGFMGIEPLPGSPDFAAIQKRALHWHKEGLRRLISSRAPRLGVANRRGYRVEIRTWMERNGISSVEKAARKLRVSESTLKSIMSRKGDIRYSTDTLDRILKEIGYESGGER